jgi:TPR repeat protein
VPSSPPPLGVAPAQQAQAEQLWQQGASLDNQNRFRDAIPVLIRAANMGHPKAQATLGILFQNGQGVRANDQAAAYWFSAAAAQGHRAAEYALGGMYEEGEGGLPNDLKRATELYIKSANQGLESNTNWARKSRAAARRRSNCCVPLAMKMRFGSPRFSPIRKHRANSRANRL